MLNAGAIRPEQEAQIMQIADSNGMSAEHLVEEDERFHADINEAIEQADRGQLIDQEEVKARIAKALQSR